MEFVAAAAVGMVLAVVCIGVGWGLAQYQITTDKDDDGN